MKILSLFSGCGGLDLGMEGGFEVFHSAVNQEIFPWWNIKSIKKDWVRLPETGFRTVFANDVLRAAKAAWVPFFTKKNNRDVSSVFLEDSIVNLVKNARDGKFKFEEEIDIVTGGFPCQDFSVAGKRKGFKSHKAHHGSLLSLDDNPTVENRGMLYWWMREVIDIVKPKMFIAENVKGLVSLSNVQEIIENDFKSVGGGYLVVPAQVLSAYEYGVPQSRDRVIFIGFRKNALNMKAKEELNKDNICEKYNPYPKKTHYLCKDGTRKKNGQLMPHVRVCDVLGDLKEPEKATDLSQQSFSKAKWMGNHCQGQIEVKLESISPTIRAEHHGNIEFRRLSKEHGGQIVEELEKGLSERRLSVRECARIQTFPDDYEFVRNIRGSEYRLSTTDAYKVIGNAVPPMLGFCIAMRLKENWELYFGGKL